MIQSTVTYPPATQTDSLAVDSLAVVASADSTTLQLLASEHDTLSAVEQVPHAEVAVVDSIPLLYREVSATELFGARTEQASLPQPTPAPHSPTEGGGFSIVVLLLVGAYALLIYRHATDVWQLLQRLTRESNADDRLYEDSAGSFVRLLRLGSLLGVGMVSALAVRWWGSLIPAQHYAEMPYAAALVWFVALLAALFVAWLYRLIITSSIGFLTFSQPLFERLQLVKRSSLTLFMVVAMPPSALWLLSESSLGIVWLSVILIELIVVFILYLHDTRQLFLSKKISILHWFLYLCGVEIFPLSLLALLVARLA